MSCLQLGLTDQERAAQQQAAATSGEDARDAARYRWLKMNIQPGYDLPGGWYLPDDEPGLWDTTIDAAMSAPNAIQKEGE